MKECSNTPSDAGSTPFAVLYDANVLYPFDLRDMLIRAG